MKMAPHHLQRPSLPTTTTSRPGPPARELGGALRLVRRRPHDRITPWKAREPPRAFRFPGGLHLPYPEPVRWADFWPRPDLDPATRRVQCLAAR